MTDLCKKFLGSAFALLIGASSSLAQGRLGEGDILHSLQGTGQAARAANLNLDQSTLAGGRIAYRVTGQR